MKRNELAQEEKRKINLEIAETKKNLWKLRNNANTKFSFILSEEEHENAEGLMMQLTWNESKEGQETSHRQFQSSWNSRDN